MASYWLPLNRINAEVPKEYFYLEIAPYPDDYLKINSSGKKLTAVELKERKQNIENHKETISQLNSGYINLYNNKHQLNTILNSWFTKNIDKDSDHLIYRIQPVAAIKETNWGSSSRDTYFTSEFKVLKNLINKEEILQQIYQDGLLSKFSAVYFDNHSYGNDGYNAKIFDYFKYIKDNFNKCEISLCDIVLSDNYERPIRSKFIGTSEITRENIRYLLDNKLIKYFKENEYYKTKLMVALVECGLFDVALKCLNFLDDYYTQDLLKNKDFNLILRKWSINNDVKQIIKKLDIKLIGITLTITKEQGYQDDIIKTLNFENIGEAKSYLIKEYNIPFEKIANSDIDNLSSHFEDDDCYYRFNIC